MILAALYERWRLPIAVLLAVPFALAGALMVVQVVLDSSDGEVARLRHMSSRTGMWLDNVSDDVIDNLFVAALGIGLGGPWVALGIAAAAARGSCALMIYRDVARAGKPGDVMAFRWWIDSADQELAERYDTTTSTLTTIRGLGRRDLYVLLWGASCMLGLAPAAFGLGVIICAAYFGLAVVHVIKTWGQR